MTAEGFVKLADFGFSKRLLPGKRTFTFCGTPDYQAPEVIMRKGTGPPADIWSLGVLIYELLSGARGRSGTHSPITPTLQPAARTITAPTLRPHCPIAHNPAECSPKP